MLYHAVSVLLYYSGAMVRIDWCTQTDCVDRRAFTAKVREDLLQGAKICLESQEKDLLFCTGTFILYMGFHHLVILVFYLIKFII